MVVSLYAQKGRAPWTSGDELLRKLQGLGCRDLKIQERRRLGPAEAGGRWEIPDWDASRMWRMRITSKWSFGQSSSLCSVKPHGWYRSHKVCRTGLEEGREKRVSHIWVAVGQRRGARAAVVGEMEWGQVWGELAAGSDYENANPWEFTCVLWEALDYSEYSEWVLGPRVRGT